jgi:hypothetical protein
MLKEAGNDLSVIPRNRQLDRTLSIGTSRPIDTMSANTLQEQYTVTVEELVKEMKHISTRCTMNHMTVMLPGLVDAACMLHLHNYFVLCQSDTFSIITKYERLSEQIVEDAGERCIC